jgi:hypothetical protein
MVMKPTATRLLVAGLLLVASHSAGAQLGNIGPLAVTTAVAGSQPAPIVAMSAYAGPVTFTGQMRIVCSLNANMPTGTTLAVRLTAPTGGTSLGDVNLDVTPRNIVVAVVPAFLNNVTIRYTFTPTVAAGVLPLTTRTATYTLLTYP